MPKYLLVIHGGAGVMPRDQMTAADDTAYREALGATLDRGFKILRGGGTSLDAVQAAVEMLEDSPLFNAGRGAVFTTAGTHELDAAIMNGHALEAGAVIGVQHIKNPIALARMVMERSPHVILAGDGAEAFAKEQGMSLVSQEYFYTKRRWASLQRAKRARATTGTGKRTAMDEHGTVGAVALDVSGHLAAATSTGGMTGKWVGRVGDTPVIGAGTYANRRCAVSATGHGEFFIRYAVAHDVCARVEYKGQSVADAANDVMRGLAAATAEGGLIAVTDSGDFTMTFTSEGMFRGAVGPDGVKTIGIYKE